MSDREDRGDFPRWEDAPRRDPEQESGRRYSRGARDEGIDVPPRGERAESSLESAGREPGSRVRRGSERSSERSSERGGGCAGSSRGLYGSEIGSNMAQAAVAELVGTFILVFTGTAVAVAAILERPAVGPAFDSLSVPLAFGLVLVALVAALGHVSGAHLNPAVTLSLAATRKFPWDYVPAYIVAQVVGAILAAFATWITLGGDARASASLAAPTLAPGVGVLQGFFVEMLITFILVFVVISVATDERVHAAVAPVAVGFALAAGVFIGGPVTGGSVNPARALGPIIVAWENWSTALIYILAPIVGGVLAALLYDNFIGKADAPE